MAADLNRISKDSDNKSAHLIHTNKKIVEKLWGKKAAKKDTTGKKNQQKLQQGQADQIVQQLALQVKAIQAERDHAHSHLMLTMAHWQRHVDCGTPQVSPQNSSTTWATNL